VAPTRSGRTGVDLGDVSEPATTAAVPKGDTGAAPEPTSVQSTDFPRFADLRPDGIMLSKYSDTYKVAWISVFNHGPGAINTYFGGATIASVRHAATLRTADGNYVTGSNVLASGKAGYLVAMVPLEAIALCSTQQVTIDSDPNNRLQWSFDSTNVFSNDKGNVKTPCLYWTSRMSKDLLEADYNEEYLGGKTLQQIVGGKFSGVQEGKCTHCHNNSPNPTAPLYHPPVAADGEFVPDKDAYYDGRRWAGPEGWAQRFQDTHYPKRAYMRGTISKWFAHGSQ
jgi:hypothetical protein